MVIRPLQIKDIFGVSKMYISISDEDRRFFHPFPFYWWIITPIMTLLLFGPQVGKFIRGLFPRAVFFSFIAVDNETREYGGLTYIQIRKKTSGNKYTATLGIVVNDKYKNKGIGSKLMTSLINQAYISNVNKIVLSVFADNAPAIQLYKQYGFINTSRNCGECWGGRFYPCQEMELTLNEREGRISNEVPPIHLEDY